MSCTNLFLYHTYKRRQFYRLNYLLVIKRDLMAQRSACRAEDREVPGSSPNQDLLFNHVHVTS